VFPQVVASPAAYALVGMGGVVAGATHAPITAILIIFEMTGDYKIILPMMITCIVSTMVAQGIKSGSIYTIKLRRRGIDIAGGLEQNILKTMLVQRYMRGDVVTVPEGMALSGLIETFKSEDASYLHVIGADKQLTGIISFRDIRGLLEEEGLEHLVIANDVATRNPVTVSPSDNIQHAMKLMSQWGISQLPVVNGTGKNTVVGVLRQKDVVAAYDKAIIRREIESG
jgi:CIC family chloride channel protein